MSAKKKTVKSDLNDTSDIELPQVLNLRFSVLCPLDVDQDVVDLIVAEVQLALCGVRVKRPGMADDVHAVLEYLVQTPEVEIM